MGQFQITSLSPVPGDRIDRHELHPSQAKPYRLAIIDKFLMAKMA
jgi:hypothetical protein